ncbi:hypothetical protein K438DRAFT_1952880 [Mycena galopus ATCC 62051]|nr:hypothetical protein K438DRAFT_1952880 [Mycena galopus ATCC 62051]
MLCGFSSHLAEERTKNEVSTTSKKPHIDPLLAVLNALTGIEGIVTALIPFSFPPRCTLSARQSSSVPIPFSVSTRACAELLLRSFSHPRPSPLSLPTYPYVSSRPPVLPQSLPLSSFLPPSRPTCTTSISSMYPSSSFIPPPPSSPLDTSSSPRSPSSSLPPLSASLLSSLKRTR